MDVSNPNYHLVMHAAAALDPACSTARIFAQYLRNASKRS